MLKRDVEIGKIYIARISGRLARVKLTGLCNYGGWYALNLETNREIRIKSAAKLRREWVKAGTTNAPTSITAEEVEKDLVRQVMKEPKAQ